MSTAEHTDGASVQAQAGLGAAERGALEALLRRYPEKRAACVEALKLVQQQHRWVSDTHLAELASLLEMTADELDAVATYYNLVYRRPVGRHVILACDSISCWLMGCEALREALARRLGIAPGETTADGRFTLLPIVCLGHCDHAPALLIDQDLHGDVDPSRVDELLEGYP